MDNSDDDQPMYVPARRSFEIVQLPASRRRPSFLVLFFVIFSALLAFWLVTHWIRAYDVRLVIHRVLNPPVVASKSLVATGSYRPQLSPMVSFYHLPFSTQYRLVGKIQDKYVATAGRGFFVVIPASVCEVVAGVRYCDYHNTAVSRFTGG